MTTPSLAQLAGLSAWLAAAMTVVGWLGWLLVRQGLVVPHWNA